LRRLSPTLCVGVGRSAWTAVSAHLPPLFTIPRSPKRPPREVPWGFFFAEVSVLILIIYLLIKLLYIYLIYIYYIFLILISLRPVLPLARLWLVLIEIKTQHGQTSRFVLIQQRPITRPQDSSQSMAGRMPHSEPVGDPLHQRLGRHIRRCPGGRTLLVKFGRPRG